MTVEKKTDQAKFDNSGGGGVFEDDFEIAVIIDVV